MTALTYTVPTVGQPASTEDAKVVTALTQILSTVNGSLDVSNLASSLQQLLHSPGDLKASVAATPETGWLLCDGSAVSRTTYSALFAKAGTAYGVGDGSTTFNLPDLRGRMPVGLATGGDSTIDTLGKNEGLSMAGRHPRHAHTVPAHAHSMDHAHDFATGVSSSNYAGGGSVGAGLSVATNTHGHSGTTNAANPTTTGTQAAVLTQDGNASFLTVSFFVKT